MHKKRPKICTGCRVSTAKIYLYHSTKIAIARPHSVEWQTDSSVQKQWFMAHPKILAACIQPKWSNQVGSLDFWWSVYSSPTSFFLAY